MLKFIIQKQKIIIIAFLAIILFTPFIPISAQDGLNKAQKGLSDSAKIAYGNNLPSADISTMIGRIIGAVLSFIGLLFFLLMIYGGFLWMTARGNQQQVSQAMDLIIGAVVGLVIISAAYLITQYIGEAILSGATTPATQ